MQNTSLSSSIAEEPQVNVGPAERLLSALAGGALTVYGLRRSGISGILMAATGGALLYRGSTGYCSMYQAAGINHAEGAESGEPVHVEHTLIIDRPPEELYNFWRNFENLPTIMNNLESVRTLDDRRSVWRAKAPAGQTVEWEAIIEQDVPNQMISWRSTPDSQIQNRGSVRFERAPGDRGTFVRVSLDYHPPAGKLGDLAAKLTGSSPKQEIRSDLRRFKQLMETGGIPMTEGQPAGYRRSMFDALTGSSK